MPDSVTTTSMRGRPSFLQRDQRGAGEAAVGVEARLGADPGERLADRAAFALEIVGSPQHQRDRFRQRVAVLAVALQHALDLARAVGDRIGARDAVGVEAVQVAPRRQDRGGAHQVAADDRLR